MRTVSGAIFQAVFIAILTAKSKSQVASIVPAAVLEAGFPQESLPQLFEAIQAGSEAALAAVPGMSPQIAEVLANALSDAYAGAFAYVCYAGAAVGSTAIIASLILKDYDKFLSGHIPRQVYNREEQAKALEAEPPTHLEYKDVNKENTV